MTAPDKYGVVGNPIAHSRSPEIHRRFARQTRERISYERIEVPLDAFEERALALRDAGFRGLNVTVPFKIDAAKLADDLMPRARLAGAVNTLVFDGDTIVGDNTDGIGFVTRRARTVEVRSRAIARSWCLARAAPCAE